jgi:hypothetical protein
VAGLLQTADGNCYAWIHLLRDAVRANGLEVDKILVLPYTFLQKPENSRLVIKEVTWDDDPTFPDSGAWKYSYEDIGQEPEDLAGQNTRPPDQKVFEYHWLDGWVVVQDPRTLQYYDPSYGMTYESEVDFTTSAVAGWGKEMADGELHFRPVKDPRPQEEKVRFEPVQW